MPVTSHGKALFVNPGGDRCLLQRRESRVIAMLEGVSGLFQGRLGNALVAWTAALADNACLRREHSGGNSPTGVVQLRDIDRRAQGAMLPGSGLSASTPNVSPCRSLIRVTHDR